MAYFFAVFFILILNAFVDLSECGQVYHLHGKFVDISAKGEEVWAIDSDRNVSRFDFQTGDWAVIPSTAKDGVWSGKPNTISASPDGWAWMTSDTHKIYRYNVTSKKWVHLGNQYDWLWQINAMSKDSVVGQGGADTTWTFPNPHPITNLKTQWAALGEDGECWVIERHSKRVWRTTLDHAKGANNVWVRMPGTSPERELVSGWAKGVAETIDVQSPKRGVMTTSRGHAFMWTGEEWTKLPVENASKATIGSKYVFVLDTVENLVMMEI